MRDLCRWTSVVGSAALLGACGTTTPPPSDEGTTTATHHGPCDASECGPAPGMPSQACPDGSVAGPVCARSAAGVCGWLITECSAPPAPPPSGDLPPPPAPEPSASPTPPSGEACVKAGCSGTLCVDASKGNIATTCEFRPEYACYRDATCARQADGACAWTKTPALDACLAHPPPP